MLKKKSKELIDSNKIKILVCCHKPCELPPDPDGVFISIQVGAAISDIDLGMQRDDQVNGQVCDNISAKNKSYCELTAIYWAWKNIKTLYPDLEYIGLNHYRRYFDFNTKKNITMKFIKTKELNNYRINNLFKELPKKNWILPKGVYWDDTLKTNYCFEHHSEDYRLLKKAIENLYPDYLIAFTDVFENGHTFHPYNMFITTFDYFEKYCEWLFKILSFVEDRSLFQYYDDVQKRVFGYLAERLLNVFVYQNSNNLKLKEFPVIFIDDDSQKKLIKNNVKNIIIHHLRNLKRKFK